MLDFQAGGFLIQVIDEACYTPGSADNVRAYDREYYTGHDELDITRGVVCTGDSGVSSVVLLAPGVPIGVDPHSAVVVGDSCFVVCGHTIFALQVPSLDLGWMAQVDTATCFGIYHSAFQACLISHGECEITRLGFDGTTEWQRSARDIFTGTFRLMDDRAEVQDFEGRVYGIDLKSGRMSVAS